MHPSSKFIAAALAAALLAMSGNAIADSTGGILIPQTADGVDDSLSTGWHPSLKGAANFALGHSMNTPGNPDGLSLQFGYLIDGGVDYLSPTKKHEWTNGLGMELQYSKTPVVDALIKSADQIDFRSAYFFHPPKLPQVGPFVSFRLTAPMLPADAVYADPQNVVHLRPEADMAFNDAGQPVDTEGTVIDANHESVTRYGSGERIPLTGAFAPLTLRESVGVFAVPVNKPTVKFDARLGFGAWETFARDGYYVQDNDATADLLELRQMQDSVQIGPELGMILSGAAKEILTYRFSALFMQPVYQNTNADLSIDLLNMEFEAGLGVKITKYIAVNYSFKAYRQPLVIDDWQIQNSLLFSVSFAVPEPPPPPPACPAPAPCPTCDPCPAKTEQTTTTPPQETATPAAGSAAPSSETKTPEAAPSDAPPSDAQPAESPANPAPAA